MARTKGSFAEETRTVVVAAARDVVITQGLRALSARTVGKAAGLAASTILAGKTVETLLADLVANAFAPLAVELSGKRVFESDTAIRKRIVGIFRCEPGLASLVTQMCGLARDKAHVADRFDSFRTTVSLLATELETHLMQKEEFTKPAAARRAAFFIRFYMNVAFLMVVWPEKSDAELLDLLSVSGLH